MRVALAATLAIVLGAAAAAEQPVQQPVPQTSMRLDGKALSVEYSPGAEPTVNGIWQAASAFRTEADLEVQGLLVPRGDYALYVMPDAKRWQLIFSMETGQRPYSQQNELGRVPIFLHCRPIAS